VGDFGGLRAVYVWKKHFTGSIARSATRRYLD